ncbi:transcription factor MYB44-like [Syzygium oleosum]|uniref:transcription factor MYB44-like n=1 Tax=Syzygium oleosum TaxID=219896 RepID=UPI0011D1FB2A|nr:transcription factor MYB44-like [Syzygium oleosum]
MASRKEMDPIDGPWSPKEDEALRRLVLKHGTMNWLRVSKPIPGRSGLSCHLRWCYQLSPQVGIVASRKEVGPWSPGEDEALRRLVQKHGTMKWSRISKSIPGRSGLSCRVRWCYQLAPHVEHQASTPE